MATNNRPVITVLVLITNYSIAGHYNIISIYSGERSERAEPVLLAREAVANVTASLTVFCVHTIAYYIA